MHQPRVQAFLRVLLALTGFPGTGSVDEDLSEVSSEMCSSNRTAARRLALTFIFSKH